jgi:hypothetical protein
MTCSAYGIYAFVTSEIAMLIHVLQRTFETHFRFPHYSTVHFTFIVEFGQVVAQSCQ